LFLILKGLFLPVNKHPLFAKIAYQNPLLSLRIFRRFSLDFTRKKSNFLHGSELNAMKQSH
jgi:hypothetical protein